LALHARLGLGQHALDKFSAAQDPRVKRLTLLALSLRSDFGPSAG
jgi:hypothetical protein